MPGVTRPELTHGPERLDPGRPQPPVTKPELAALVAILVVAAFFVGWDPGGYAFQMDSAEFAERGRAIAAGRELPLAGANVASGEAGRWTGPLAYYLTALPFFLTSSIRFAAVVFGTLVPLAAVLLWSTARALFGRGVALTAAALFVSSAQVAIEHRLLLFSSLAPFFVVALLRACVAWGPHARPRAVLAVIALTGALTQLHVVHVAFVAIVPVTYWRWRPRVDRRAAWIGVALVAAMQLPWVVEQVLVDGRDAERFVGWLSSRGRGGTELDLAASARILGNAASAPFRVPLDMLEEQGEAPSWLHRVGLATLGVLTGAGVVLSVRERRWRRPMALVAAWVVPPFALFVLGQNGVYSFHLLSLLPAFALFAAFGAERMTAPLGARQAWVLGPLVAGLVLAQASLVARIGERVAAQGYARFPMSMVLSYPDDLWRYPVDVEFPTLRDVDHIEALLARQGFSATVRGRVHGPLAMALSHYPPVLPAFPDGRGPAPRSDDPHFRLARGEVCEGAAPQRRSGPWCLLGAPAPGLLSGWWTHRHDGAATRSGFPADTRGPQRWWRDLPGGTTLDLTVWTLGPSATRMDRPTAPSVEVTLDGRHLEPLDVAVGAPFWVLAERRYAVHTEDRARLEIRVAQHDVVVDAWVEGAPR